MAMASAAALELRPFCPAEGLGAKELCWMTGAGEPVGSEVSFILSSAATKGRGDSTSTGLSFVNANFALKRANKLLTI